MCDRASDPSQHDAPRRADDPFEHAFAAPESGYWCRTCGFAESQHPDSLHRYRPCEVCGGSPDVHNTNRGKDFIGHEYR